MQKDDLKEIATTLELPLMDGHGRPFLVEVLMADIRQFVWSHGEPPMAKS
jgi:hypothetical protein